MIEVFPFPKFQFHDAIVLVPTEDTSLNVADCPTQRFAYVKSATGFAFLNTNIESETALHNPFPVVVNTKNKVSASVIEGIYDPFNVESFGLKIPKPLVFQTAPVGIVLILPNKLIGPSPLHITISVPALTVGEGVIVNTSESAVGEQALIGVNLMITLPVLISIAPGI
jgi:hypothetical protein